MASITKRINGIDLHNESRGWSLQAQGTSARVARAVRRAPLAVGGRHGSVARGALPVYDEASVSLSWFLEAATQSGLEQAYADLVGVLSGPALSYEHVTDGVVTSAPAELASISEPSGFFAGRLMSVSAELALGDPFLRDVTPVTTGILPAGTSTVSALAGTAPLADPVVRFSASTDPAVTDVATGTGLVWRGTIAAGSYVYADPSTMRAWRSTAAAQWVQGAATDVSSTLDYPGPGRLQVWPTRALVSGALVATAQVTTTGPTMIRGRRAWL